MKRVISLAIVLLAILIIQSPPAFAQGSAQGTILGSMVDTTGALIPNAAITIVNLDTNTISRTKTNSEGVYTVPYLRPGTYSVSGEAEGFSREIVEKVTLVVGQNLRVNLTMHPGQLSESVSVTATELHLDTDNAAVSTTVNQQQVVDLPLNGRDFIQLMFLDATASATYTEASDMSNGTSIGVAGARASSNLYLLDGQAINNIRYQTLTLSPSVDIIQEFTLQEHLYSAEYGGASNQVNVSTKSGTNEFHGTAFEFMRNDKLDARNFFDGAQISPLRQNQYGFVLGGPVWIPKLYNGKNKSFFLANYEAGKVRSNAIQYSTVPTPEQLKGQFTTAITDPVSGAAFPNNTIPAASFSRIGPLFAQEIGTAVPNNPGPLNYVMHNSSPSDGWQQTYRWDQYFGANDQFFGRFSFMNSSGGGYTWPDKASWRGHSTPVKSLQTVYTHTFSPRVINQARFGWLHNEDDTEGTPASQATLDKLGIQGVYTGIPGTTYPLVTLTGYGEYGGAPNTPSLSTGTNWDVSDSLSINLGRHTINAGANYRHYQLFDTGSGAYYGEWDYSGAYTGDAVADMLLGYMGRISATVPTFISPKPAFTTVNKFYIAPYVQDDWRVNERLTVNLGLRYDYTSLPTEAHNLNAWWDYTNTLGGLCVADKKVIDAGLGSDVYRYCGANPGTAPTKVFAPRVGVAYRPFGGTKTVIRSGYGIYYDSTEREFAGSYVYYPYGAGITTQAYPEDPTKWVRSDNQLPVLNPGPVDRSQVMGFVGGGFPRTLAPYSQQWTFSVQRELTRATVFEASYLGTKGTHLLTRSNINQPYPYDPNNPLSIEARRPYPTVGVALTELYDSSSSYNALNLKLQHHAGDLNLLVNYAWSKSIDNKSAASTAGSDQGWGGVTNQWNLRYDRGLSDFDTPQRLVIAFNYDLPLGHGKRFLPSLNKAGNLLLGGWQLNGIANFQSGAAYSIMSYDFSGLLGLTAQHMQRADLVGDPNSGFHRSLSQWFNTAAFNWPADGLFGTSGRNIMRGPGYANWDLSLFKNIPVYGERARLQLRGESFNAFNHTQFDHPDGYMIDPIFGMIASARSGRIIQVAAKLIF